MISKLNTTPVEFVDVVCSQCGAKPGRQCRGTERNTPHYTRRLDAYKARARELTAAALEVQEIADGLGFSGGPGEGIPYHRATAAEIVAAITAERQAAADAAEMQQRAVDAAVAATLDAVAERMRNRAAGFGPGTLQMVAEQFGLEHYRTPAQRAAGGIVFDLVQPEPVGHAVATAQWDGTHEGAEQLIVWLREHLGVQAQLIGFDEPHRMRYYAERNRLGGLTWEPFVLIHPHGDIEGSTRVRPGDYIVRLSTGRIRIMTAADFAAQYTEQRENTDA